MEKSAIFGEAQEAKKNLEEVLDFLSMHYRSSKIVERKETSGRAVKYLSQALDYSIKDGLQRALFEYMSKMDIHMRDYFHDFSGIVLNSENFQAASIDNELKLLYTGEGREAHETSLPTEDYVTDEALAFHNREVSPIKDLIPQIAEIKESHNVYTYRDEAGRIEFEGSSRRKTDIVPKLLISIFGKGVPTGYRLATSPAYNYLLTDGETPKNHRFASYLSRRYAEALGKSGIPQDFGGFLYTSPKHDEQLYKIRDIIRNISSSPPEEEYRNMPEEYDEHKIKEFLNDAEEVSRRDRPLTGEEINKMKTGIWIDFSYNGMLIEAQLYTKEGFTLMQTHPDLHHEVYKRNNEVDYFGIEKEFESLVRDAAKALRDSTNYSEQRRNLSKPGSVQASTLEA